MASHSISAYQTKIHQLLFGLAVVCIGLYAVRSMMGGQTGLAKMVGGLVIATAVVFALDRYYWLLVPVFMSGAISIPRIPFDGFEMAALSVIAVHFVRLGLHRDFASTVDRDIFPSIPLILWIGIVYCLNPTGLNLMGSSTIGARFYLKIALGFMALFALSTQRIDEKGAQLLFYTLLLSLSWRFLRGVLKPQSDPDELILIGEAATVSARYAFLRASLIYTVLFSRWALSDILSSFPKTVLMFILALFTVYSGKRSAFARLALIPVLRVFLVGREKMLTAIIAFFCLFFLIVAINGDGTFYNLPRSATRALAIVDFSKYAKSRDDGGVKDVFRKEMRALARRQISENPWVGRKGFAMDREQTAWVYTHGGAFGGHAYAGAWHSTLYGYAADFGIPGLMFFLYFAWRVIRVAVKAPREVTSGTYLPAVCLWSSFELLYLAVFSYTSGSSFSSLEWMLRYGMLLAIVRGYRELYPTSTKFA